MVAFSRRYYDGGGATTSLANSMGLSDTTFVLTGATGWPGATPPANFTVVIDRSTPSEEKILCSGNTGTTVTVVTRGIDGTSAATHNATATVSLCGIAQDFDEANQISNLLGNLTSGSLLVGAGAATLPTALGIGADGSYLGVSAGAVGWVQSSAYDYGYGPGSPVSLPAAGTYETVLTTSSLAIGTWKIDASMLVLSETTAANTAVCGGKIIAGTATATLSGLSIINNIGTGVAATTAWELPVYLTAIAVVTVAGTLLIQGRYQSSGSAGEAINNGAGYTAFRIQ